MPVREQPTRVTADIENTPKPGGNWLGRAIIAGPTKQHKLDNGGRGKQPNKEAMGRKGVGGRPREDSGEVSVGLVRRWRRTDIRYISEAVVEKRLGVGPVGLWHWGCGLVITLEEELK
ncbi:hypothetical protein BY996DRAFT_6575841 [Phakopsora pachyrhizi]|nr:hypothetical protein BY996DRAFT_6575841 [Phakopsora pachyrhizi]